MAGIGWCAMFVRNEALRHCGTWQGAAAGAGTIGYFPLFTGQRGRESCGCARSRERVAITPRHRAAPCKFIPERLPCPDEPLESARLFPAHALMSALFLKRFLRSPFQVASIV